MNKFSCFESGLYYANEKSKESYTEMELQDAFAKSLKELREYCRLPMLKFAKEVDIAQPTISSYENKTRTPSFLQAIKLTAYFGLTIEEFILCGLDCSEYDITELYENRKKEL